MYKQKIYCEIDFLRNFFSNRPDFKVEGSSNYDIWDNYKKLFFANCLLTLDCERKYKELLIEKNELFIILNKRWDGGSVNIRFNKIDFATFQNESIDELFFLTDTKKCKELEDDYGMIFISNDILTEKAYILFNQATVPIEKKGNIFTDWNFMDKYIHPCNSMIIADNYLLKNNKELKNNLLTLLDKFLPQKLNKLDFHLTIITGDGRTVIDVVSYYKYLKTELQKMRNTYNINLKIIGKSVDNHDRNIITNYLHIHSGFGFTLFKKSGYPPNERNIVLANTTISINSSICRDDAKIMVSSLKKQYKNIDSNVRNIGSEKIVFPEDCVVNRLIEFPE